MEPASKKAKLDDSQEKQAAAAPAAGSEDQVEAALTKIKNHISNAIKFSKASGLLIQLLQGDVLSKRHKASCFEAIKAAFPFPANNCTIPNLRKDYLKLGAALLQKSEYFGPAEQAQLEVYHIWAVTQNQLFTDDSFVFSKVLSTIKTLLSSLPDVEPEDERAWSQLTGSNNGDAALAIKPEQMQPTGPLSSSLGPHQTGLDVKGKETRREREVSGVEEQKGVKHESDDADALKTHPHPTSHGGATSEEQEQPAAHTSAAAAGDENAEAKQQSPDNKEGGNGVSAAPVTDDPFGLDMLFQEAPKPKPKPKPAAKPVSAWTAVHALCMKRQAVLDCLLAAKTMCKQPWARVGVELTIQEALKHMNRFCGSQRRVLLELKQFVQEQQFARRRGPSSKEVNRDSTSFERARAAWSQATISARGKVGAGGDHKAENWLG